MKKSILILALILMSFTGFAKGVILCLGGNAVLITYHICPCCGKLVVDSETNLGPCGYMYSGGPIWLNRVTGTGNPTDAEANNTIYNNLSINLVPQAPANPHDELLNEYIGQGTSAWIDPGKLSAAAFALLYDNENYLDIFYVSSCKIDDSYKLLLYSDNSRSINVEYRDITGTLISSESVYASPGSNNLNLIEPENLTAGCYLVKVISNSSFQNINLLVD
ncbi:MAG TPA: hypothetical protein PLQ93_12420 [Bacteroidia bacterium]|nr:hypothetical protein [Bacteroidia bacterium]